MDTNKKHIIKYGDTTIDLGADEKYQPMCWECWNKAN
jgi:thymidine kinase